MEAILQDIIDELQATGALDGKAVDRVLQKHNRLYSQQVSGSSDTPRSGHRRYAKKHLMPYYLRVKDANPALWQSWNLSPHQEDTLLRALRMKPRRTASGVATITVLTKPWPCGSDCLYCPNDVRMPKSYLSDEPACQRAERNFFDPYLQVASRLRALEQMGHATDKVELIVLGGTWSDYPETYQIWFVTELFRALNDAEDARSWSSEETDNNEGSGETPGKSLVEREMHRLHTQYAEWGVPCQRAELQAFTRETQQRVDAGELSYNQAVARLYDAAPWRFAARTQTGNLRALEDQHVANETARHRVVGLVVETRPDAVTPAALTLLRQLGCTKVQMGIQSLNAGILHANSRGTSLESVRHAFELLRLFGFKTHAHFMVNLLGATPEADKADYREFVTNPAYLPDEVKLYPCVLVGSAALRAQHDAGTWQPYTEEELVDVLVADTLATPAFTRVSRMIRDISAHDIVAGNKKTNLRQLVENRIAASGAGGAVREIRYREIGTDGADEPLALEVVEYATTATTELFLQWVTPENRIAGFLRLSLPHQEALAAGQNELPVCAGEAMIREVHVYGKAARLHSAGESAEGAQHLGLGKRLVETACSIARERGYHALNVISSVGTRGYYRMLGFEDAPLYQRKTL